MELLILKSKNYTPTNYTLRKTVKGVIIDFSNQKVLLISDLLVGGGVEENETDAIALARESLEEAGIEIEIIQRLGQVIQYRDALKKKYVVTGYFCRYLGTISKPTTLDVQEQLQILSWNSIEKAIAKLEISIKKMSKAPSENFLEDRFQGKLFNSKTTLAFLKQAQDIIQNDTKKMSYNSSHELIS